MYIAKGIFLFIELFKIFQENLPGHLNVSRLCFAIGDIINNYIYLSVCSIIYISNEH